jgi:uncharacterized protein YbjT (DUF2867 family)
MKEKKIIAVVGATGAQGSGLIEAITADPAGEFAARALVRSASAPGAKALAGRGIEVVEADLDDPESVNQAFRGAYGAFCVTFFWHHMSPEKEIEHARTMAAAARRADLRHVVWSTLEDTRRFMPLTDERMPTLMEKYKVPHLDAKGEADAIFREAGVPTTYLLTSFYWENFVSFGMGPTRSEDGKLSITMPMGDAPLPGIAARDIGRCAYGIFKRGLQTAGETVGIAGEHLTGSEMAAAFSRLLGADVTYNAVDPSAYRSFGFPAAEELGNMFQFKRDFNEAFRSSRDVNTTRDLNPSLMSFSEWLEANRNHFGAA